MSTFVALAVLASALVHAGWNAALKGRGTTDPLVGSMALSAVWALVGFPLIFVVDPIPATAWLPLGASVLVHLTYFTMLTLAYRGGDLSFVYTVARGLPPALVTFAAFALLDERPSLGAIGGVTAIVLGVFALGLTGRGAPPLRVLSLSVATAVCISTYTMLDGVAARNTASPISYLVWLTTLQGTLFAVGAVAFGGRAIVTRAWDRWKTALFTGILSAAGYGVVLWAMTVAPIALVAALRETAVLFAAIVGALVLGEPFGRRRILGAFMVAVGAVLVRLGG